MVIPRIGGKGITVPLENQQNYWVLTLNDLGMAEGSRRDDWYAPEAIQNEQIGVTGNDDIGAAVNRQFEEFIVLGVASRGDVLGNRHQFGISKYLASRT